MPEPPLSRGLRQRLGPGRSGAEPGLVLTATPRAAPGLTVVTARSPVWFHGARYVRAEGRCPGRSVQRCICPRAGTEKQTKERGETMTKSVSTAKALKRRPQGLAALAVAGVATIVLAACGSTASAGSSHQHSHAPTHAPATAPAHSPAPTHAPATAPAHSPAPTHAPATPPA